MSYYWTMDEPGALDKVDSAQAHTWPTRAGSSSPAGLFSNGIQMDCLGGLTPPNCHGLKVSNDVGLAINSATSTGISFWFWTKLVATGAVTNNVEFYFEFHDGGFVLDFNFWLIVVLTPGVGNAGWTLNHQNLNGPEVFQSTGNFTNTVGPWRLFAATLDVVNHQLKFYIDGVLMDTVVDTLALSSTTQGDTLLMAQFGAGGIGDTFQAIVDEFGLSLSGVLSQAQVTALWNGGVGETWPAVQTTVPYP